MSNCDCSGDIIVKHCGKPRCLKYAIENNLKIIDKTVRISSLQYTMGRAAQATYSGAPVDGYRNMSDKKRAGIVNRHVSRRQTRHRPGSASAGGSVGVDVKNGSYARYLNKLKGKTFKKEKINKGICNCDELS